jgi:hypothetical protein
MTALITQTLNPLAVSRNRFGVPGLRPLGGRLPLPVDFLQHLARMVRELNYPHETTPLCRRFSP